MSQNKPLEINVDYIINSDGDLVFTKNYHLKRGYCCQSACLNCPYGFNEKTNPFVPAELNDAWDTEYEVDSEEDIDQDN
jgi:Family of unknown function (DUF5522)